MQSAMEKIFTKIRAGYAVDWPMARNRLIRLGVDKQLIDRAVDVKAYSTKEHQVVIIDDAAFSEVEILAAPIDRSSRSAASRKGNTHAAGVNGALLAVWVSDEETPANRVFMDTHPFPKPSRRHALIIENEECFLNKEFTHEFATGHCGVNHDIDDIEFIYGSGNSITNRRILPYLQSFEGEVFCMLDVDLGGIRIYSNLLSGGLDPESTHFLVPDDLSMRLSKSRRKASQRELDGLSPYYGKTDALDKLITAIRYYKTTIEQESYRTHG